MVKISTLKERGIYQDLMNEFRNNGNNLYIVSPTERREKQPTKLTEENGVKLLNVRTFNIQKTNIVEKGIGTLMIEPIFLRAIKKHLSKVKFDLIIYSTPPITLLSTVSYLKKRDQAKTYLLLKDIFPQNAVDLKMMNKNGILYRFFRKKEKELYDISDTIGCMSPANATYVLKHNKKLSEKKVEVNPNSINPVSLQPVTEERKKLLKANLEISEDAKIFIYGGNLGKPQGLESLYDLIENYKSDNRIYFLVVGSGTEVNNVKKWFKENLPKNAKFIEALPKAQYDEIVQISDVGLIFLHKNFTIPNFPSRLLSYLESSLPVLCITDPNTDIGKVVEEAGAGFGIEVGDKVTLKNRVEFLLTHELSDFKHNAYQLLLEKYLVQDSYRLIMEKMI